ncbi:MAG TPA: RcnB family protein, partial [Rhizomicrobium sp.]|nr:RcnB family protein [Rhizomicrobium sp.]
YWLTSWWLFDLAIPPYGFEWVRYGDDALLVNVYTGQILEVEYDVFYLWLVSSGHWFARGGSESRRGPQPIRLRPSHCSCAG